MPHSKRDIRKYRGSRTHGYGTIGQHRKGGQRGGKGKAGMRKGGWTWTVKYDPKRYIKDGFQRPPRIMPDVNPINLGEIENKLEILLTKGIAVQKGKEVSINLAALGVSKVLGSGKITRPLTISAPSFSKTAIQKIEAAGGTAVIPEE